MMNDEWEPDSSTIFIIHHSSFMLVMFEKLIDVEQCPPGSSMFVPHGDLELAVFHLTDPDRFVVSNNACPHASGNLSAGEIHRGTVTCPVHKWKFDLGTGHCVGTDDVLLKRYECKVEGGVLWADLSKPLPVTPPPKYDF